MVRYFIAILFIVIGTILVLTNVGAIEFEFNISMAWHLIYPMLFVAIGLKWWIDHLRRKGGSWVFGSFFIIFGLLLLLDRFGIIHFTFWDVFKLWPLLIVYIGFMLIKKPNMNMEDVDESDRRKKKTYNHSFFSIGDHHFSEPNWKVQPMNFRTFAGDLYFDFSKAYIPEKEIPITIHCFAGDVNIVIPENIEFQVNASVKAGEIEVLGQTSDGIYRSMIYSTTDYEQAVRKIDFQIHLKAGSIRIAQV
ncbi:cell wall-active antibiotics response protein LiaF [Oceanobacillus salinisoli]|uniref:cell wall-active antibiotics response protein LiaF n=1 Tax=Oceanobacillus salinisoli TaxID=2678611 RepID=UPI001E512725|nr:cell wall-active antibiotics response protein LiaF [Oceanobacillus salinisoli]